MQLYVLRQKRFEAFNLNSALFNANLIGYENIMSLLPHMPKYCAMKACSDRNMYVHAPFSYPYKSIPLLLTAQLDIWISEPVWTPS
jgi:E3 ubiquitin-protein ligase DOA10